MRLPRPLCQKLLTQECDLEHKERLSGTAVNGAHGRREKGKLNLSVHSNIHSNKSFVSFREGEIRNGPDL